MKRWRSLLLVAATALVLIAARQVLRRAGSPAAAAAPGAEWIWAETRGEAGAPAAFFAVKDFALDFPVTHAELRIVADEEFRATLNGRDFGAGSYPESGALAAYSVGDVLGRRNRLLVELRSARGAGGLLAWLDVSGRGGRRQTVVSDGTWRVVRRFDESLPRPGSRFRGEPPRVWGPQPTGRWGRPTAVVDTLSLRGLQNGAWRPAVPAVRLGRHGAPWRVARPRATRPLGPWVRFDFGRERTGYLTLRFADRDSGRGFVYYELRRPPDGLAGYGDVVLRIAGRDHWTASRPAKFRFVTVAGMPAVTRVEVIPVNPDKVAGLLAREPLPSLLGIERRGTLVSPVEDEIRGQLEGVPGLARRKEG
ncbi:MAG: hypothetical protein OES32_14180 [Acidobacteriota bacterium]|nr:hypothetical protein [Acidobacteriota bacterium]MDH3524729.1 hypothetical protein [Acidobacteriota bacterium]